MSKTFHRVLLKISGDCFSQDELLNSVVNQIVQIVKNKTKLAVVIGGGNIIRGKTARNLDPIAADRAGMLATVINGIRLTALLEQQIPVHHFAAFSVGGFVDQYNIDCARKSLAQGKVLILAGGTGHPHFSTDSAAALRAIELKMDVILKGTRVGGVFSADPEKNPKARFYRQLSYEEVLAKKLEVMDLTAFTLCQTHRIPIVVFDITQPQAILKIIKGKKIGSYIC